MEQPGSKKRGGKDTATLGGRRWGRYWMRAVLGLSVSLSLLLLVEVCLRMSIGPPGAPVQIYSGIDGLRDHWFVADSDGIRTTYQNTRGDRGTWIPFENPRQRIAVLGGSSVHGGSTDLSSELEFASLLQERLDVDVYNLGRVSLDSHDLLAIMEELQVVEMDAWVVYTGHNDFGNTYFHQRYAGWSGGLVARLQGVMSRLQIYTQLSQMVGRVRANTSDPDPRNQFGAPEIGRTQKMQALVYLEQNLRRMAWLASENDVPLIFVVPASRLEVRPKGQGCETEDFCAVALYEEGRLAEARDADSIPLRAPSYALDMIRRVATEEGVDLVDADSMLPRQPGESYPDTTYFMDVVHFTESGHRAMADLIAPTLGEVLSR